MKRRDFLRLTGLTVAGGFAALTGTSVRRAAAASTTSERAVAALARPTSRPSQPSPADGQIAPAAYVRRAGVAPEHHRGAFAQAEVVPGLYRLTNIRGVNAYLWMPQPDHPGTGETILFDCGWPWSGRDLAASLEGLGCQISDIRTLAITHADFDHAGDWLRSLKKAALNSSPTNLRRRAWPAASGAPCPAPVNHSTR